MQLAKAAVPAVRGATKSAAKLVRKVVRAPVVRAPVAPKPVVRSVRVAAPARPPSKAGRRSAPAATRLVRIKALDPCARCGPNTCVEQLYRVDEQVAGTATVHLVFFDRHGWYCVHGASCVAVRDVHAELKAQRAGSGRRR